MTSSSPSLFASLTVTLIVGVLSGCTGAASTGDGQEPVNRDAYPDATFGVEDGSIIENHSFVLANGDALDFQDVRSDESRSLLLLSTAAGWCTACIEEQGFLEAQYVDRGSDGLTVMVSLFEDRDFQPADTALAATWKETHELTFDVVTDAPFVLSAYYDPQVTPMNMLVDLNTMEILHIVTGTDQSAIQALIDASLP